MERIRRIRINPSARALGSLVLAAAALVLVVLAARSGLATSLAASDKGSDPPTATSVAGSDASDPLPLPPDVVALGDVVTPISPKGMIPLDQALDVARREFPFISQPGDIDAYLVKLTDPDQLGGAGARDRPIWIIRVSGAWDIFSAPLRPDGTAPDPGLATLGYIYVDAVTGAWLQAHFQ